MHGCVASGGASQGSRATLAVSQRNMGLGKYKFWEKIRIEPLRGKKKGEIPCGLWLMASGAGMIGG